MWKQARKGLGPKMESIKHQRVSFLKDRGVSDVSTVQTSGKMRVWKKLFAL